MTQHVLQTLPFSLAWRVPVHRVTIDPPWICAPGSQMHYDKVAQGSVECNVCPNTFMHDWSPKN